MNQSQRQFLIDNTNKVFKQQVKDLEDTIPKQPILNNYIVQAFMTGTVQFKDIVELQKKMTERVLSLDGGKLVEKDSSWRSSDSSAYLKVPVEELLILPQAYVDACAEYELKAKAVKEQITLLEQKKNSIILRVQLSSNTKLDKLISEVDNMDDLSLLDDSLMLGTAIDSGKGQIMLD